MIPPIAFIDLEVDPKTKKIFDLGCITSDGTQFHGTSIHGLFNLLNQVTFIAGHNILLHDLPQLRKSSPETDFKQWKYIDTLLLSPLLFPARPYHRLIKDDKISDDSANNPLCDSIKARDLFFDEISAFRNLDGNTQTIFFHLLGKDIRFTRFFEYIGYIPDTIQDIITLIHNHYRSGICENSPINEILHSHPIELAYALSLIKAKDRQSILPRWLLHSFPMVEPIIKQLRGTPCQDGCSYCNESLDARKALKKYFGYESYRSYDGEPLQEKAVTSAINNKSLLSIFPTGGGKSITFQVPALISSEAEKGLTVVISPLQSLMKDQVDNLLEKQITSSIAINGMLDPIERSKALEMVADGSAGILYISPESLRSATIGKVLLGRNISRFVIDEAHCFSSWGQDFRVDYLYIAEFIKTIQEKKNLEMPIPVSCFSATAKPQVVSDIRQYFKSRLNLDLELFQASVRRKNLHYKVIHLDSDESKYDELRKLIAQKNCPIIVYVSRTKRAENIASKLTTDGYEALPFHGKMESQEKTANQNAFITGKAKIMVATSAFGMGVDKKDVGMVIHYDISDSLENYVQEAGRAGRDESLKADCYILYNPEDLDKHFIRLNQTKMSQAEINQIWRAIKDLTKKKYNISNSVLEIARKGGWEEGITDLETRVKTAIAALETANYLKRKQNMPQVLATSIEVVNADEAIARVNNSNKIRPEQKVTAIRIIKSLISASRKTIGRDEEVESRVDYIAERLGITVYDTIEIINLLREEKILADSKEIQISIDKADVLKSQRKFEDHVSIELALTRKLHIKSEVFNLKELLEEINSDLQKDYSPTLLNNILNYWVIKKWCKRNFQEFSRSHLQLQITVENECLRQKIEKRVSISAYILDQIRQTRPGVPEDQTSEELAKSFSIIELRDGFNNCTLLYNQPATVEEIEDSLFYLTRTGALRIEGGFMVTYNKIQIERIEQNNKVQFKKEDYSQLAEYYEQKAQQIHIVGEYAKKMAKNYEDAITFTEDYFSLPYDRFIRKYFPGEKEKDLKLKMSPEKYKRIFENLDDQQREILHDKNQHIVVAAGPGSGKTRILVSKMASLLLMEDIKHEQLLMLTFSRAAALEFKKRLLELIGNAAHYVEIKTFHSYCFDLLGRQGSLEKSNDIIKTTVEKIRNGEIEPSRITKQVLVIDEAQDINADEFELIKVLLEQNDTMRTLIVGDDDQNIFSFRGSTNKALREMAIQEGSKLYSLLINYRSAPNIVYFSNHWVRHLKDRIKLDSIVAKSETNGLISLTQYSNNNFNKGLTDRLVQERPEGTTAVLTWKNEEALQLQCQLDKKGIPTHLIQGNEGFNLINLQELKEFTEQVCNKNDSPVISIEDWKNAIDNLKRSFQRSSNLEECLSLIEEFEKASPSILYKSDWKTLLAESSLGDFTCIGGNIVYLSTIHKAKGREFDNVYLMLNGMDPKVDETKRLIYVALTRTKNNLYIHYNGSYFEQIKVEGQVNQFDYSVYDLPAEIKFNLTHKDVQLWYFEYVQKRIAPLQAGTKLEILENSTLGYDNKPIIKFSNSFKEKLEVYFKKGYQLSAAEINYIVNWWDADKGNSCLIVLPRLILTKLKAM